MRLRSLKILIKDLALFNRVRNTKIYSKLKYLYVVVIRVRFKLFIIKTSKKIAIVFLRVFKTILLNS